MRGAVPEYIVSFWAHSDHSLIELSLSIPNPLTMIIMWQYFKHAPVIKRTVTVQPRAPWYTK